MAEAKTEQIVTLTLSTDEAELLVAALDDYAVESPGSGGDGVNAAELSGVIWDSIH